MPAVPKAQCFSGSKKYPNASVNFDYQNEEFSQAHGETVPCSGHLPKDKNLQPQITQDVFEYQDKCIVFVFVIP